MPFWPQNITDKHNLTEKLFVVRIFGTSDISTPLPYYKSRSDLIRLRNKVIYFSNIINFYFYFLIILLNSRLQNFY